jgi:hypothetical protein
MPKGLTAILSEIATNEPLFTTFPSFRQDLLPYLQLLDSSLVQDLAQSDDAIKSIELCSTPVLLQVM